MRQGAFALRVGKDRQRQNSKMEMHSGFDPRRFSSARVRELNSNLGAAETQMLLRMPSANCGAFVGVADRHLLRFSIGA
jgi:hypothetical protein